MNSKKATRNFIYSMLSQIVTIGMGLLIPRLILVGYGSEINGLLNSVTQFIVYLNLFEAGIQLVAVQSLYKPVSIDDQDKINRILSAVNKNYKKTGLAYLAALVYLSFLYPLFVRSRELHYWTAFGVMLFSGLGNVVVFFFQGKYRILLQAEGKHYVLTNLQTILTVLVNLAKVICLYLGCNVVVVVFSAFAINILQIIYIQMYIARKYPWLDLEQPPETDALSQKNAALIHQLAGMVFQNTDVLILTVFCGLKTVSVYSVYKLITSHLAAVLLNIYNSFSFALGQKFNTDKRQFTSLIDTVDVYFGGTVFVIYAVTACLIVPFVSLYTRGVTDITYVDPGLGVLFVAVELLTFIRLPMLNTINYAGHFQRTIPQTLAETAINLFISLTAVHFWGIKGVLLGTIAALVYRGIDVILYANNKILQRKAWKTLAIYGTDLLILTVVIYLMRIVPLHVDSYKDFLFCGICLLLAVSIIYIVILSFVFPQERRLVWKMINSIIFQK